MTSPIQRFRFDVSDPVGSWKNVFDSMLHSIKLALQGMTWWYKNQILFLPELEYIASQLDLTLTEILILQLYYEINSSCTSIVTQVDGQWIYARSMDWPLDFLRNVTIELEYVKDGQPIALVTTWLGYVGVLTGMRYDGYTVGVNWRGAERPPLISCVQRTLAMKWPIGYLLRTLLSEEPCSAIVEEDCQAIELISGCYLTIVTPAGGVMITRDRENAVLVRRTSGSGGLVQTNIDSMEAVVNVSGSKERLTMVQGILESHPAGFKSYDEMRALLFKVPVLQPDTVYIVHANPSINTYKTTV
jgi:hypothetical protein